MHKKFNKRGDIPITILVIGVFAICVLAILSFNFANSKIVERFVGIGLIETINSVAKEINTQTFLTPATSSFKEINYQMKGGKIEVDLNGNIIIGKWSISSGWFFNRGWKELIKVEYKFKP